MINESYVKVKSFWGHNIENLLLTHSPKTDSLVVLFPGGDYSCDRPLLHYARKAALLSGCDVLSLEYGYFKTDNSFKVEFLEDIIKESNEAVQLCLSNSYKNINFISKSIGTAVAGEISKSMGYDKVNNLFLTPISHTLPHIINSNCTVVVGTRDKFFTQENIDTISLYPSVGLHLVENAGHSLELNNDYVKSLDILREIADLCAGFVRKNRDEAWKQ